jgi:hypothetical protein
MEDKTMVRMDKRVCWQCPKKLAHLLGELLALHIDVPATASDQLLITAPRLSSFPEPVKDLVTSTTRHTPKQNRLMSALEAFYYCMVFLGGDVNFMNKQAVGLSPPYAVRPQSQAEKDALAARKAQRVVKRCRLSPAATADREVQKEILVRELGIAWSQLTAPPS